MMHRTPVFIVVVAMLAVGGCSQTDDAADEETTTTAAAATTVESTATTVADSSTTVVATSAAEPLTIMPIGDSITQGQTGWSTYRCYLDGMLDEAGVFFDFVGSHTEPNGGGTYGCPSAFDQDHEGWWGIRVDTMNELGVATASAQALQPDVALIHLGTNDLAAREGPASTVSELELLITGLQAVKPDMNILVAQIIPCDPIYCSDDVPAFNEAIATFSSLSTGDSSVIVVDMETGFGLSDLRDPFHPTDAGDELIASRWMKALEDAGLI